MTFARQVPGLKRLLPWVGAVALVTASLIQLRGVLDKAHVALAYLLVVLAGSARLGRPVGAALSVLCFLCFNFFLLPPYHTLALEDPRDWLVLLAFLVTSLMAAELLHRAQWEAAAARQRVEEIDRLSTLGAETLSVGRAADAVEAVARVIQSTLPIGSCEIYQVEDGARAFRLIGKAYRPGHEASGGLPSNGLFRFVVDQTATVLERTDGTSHVVASDGDARTNASLAHADARAILIPLCVRGRAVGILRFGDDAAIRLDESQRRFAEALSYYAALGVERVRLAAAAERAEALREADRLKDALMASVSHDLRTPLTTIKALAHELREPENERAAMIEVEADRLNRLVADLLDLSLLNAGGLRLEPRILAADDLIGAALDRLAGIARAADVQPRLEGAEPVIGRFDFVHSLRALVNLIENALKYSPPGSVVEVVARRQGQRLVFSVLDRGAGIPASEAERIFEPFYRSPATAPDIAGSGLGLAIAQRLVQAQGGTIHYTPRPGGGSVFSLHLPAVELADLNEKPS